MLRRLSVLAGLLLCAVVAGCTSQPSNFYILSAPVSASTEAVQTTRRRGPLIGVGPITMPQYLDRTEIVTRDTATSVNVNEQNRWGGGLTENFQNVLAEVLSEQLRTDRLFLYPWTASGDMTYQITVQVNAFEARPDGQVVLDARWTVLSGGTQEVITMGRTLLREPVSTAPTGVSGPDYTRIAAAMSRSVARLAQEIAASGLRS